HPTVGAAAEQLDLDLADPASDLHHRRAVEPALFGPVGDSPRVVATEPLAQVPAQLPSRPLLPEDVERLTGTAGARHDVSMPARRQARGMRASRAAPSASRTGSSSIRSSTSWKKPRTMSRSASERGSPRAIRYKSCSRSTCESVAPWVQRTS